MPVVVANMTLSRLRCLGQCTTPRAEIKGNFIAVLIKNPLSGSHYKCIDSIVCQLQNPRVIREQLTCWVRAILSLTLSNGIGTPMCGFCCAHQMPLCEMLLRRHELVVVPKHVPGFFGVHRVL